MSLKSLLRKASMGLGGLLLACNIGCNRVTYPQTADIDQRAMPANLENKIRTTKLKAWQYPVNIIGGFLTHISVHESGHAIAGLTLGTGIKEYHVYPGINRYGNFHGGWVSFEPSNLPPEKRAIRTIAGPAADITLAEVINYNLRHGKVSPEAQPFWATTSLMARGGPIWIAIAALSGQKGSNDFYSFERHAKVPKETMAGLVGLYTVLSTKRIAKEFRVALGKDSYDHNSSNTRIDLIPTPKGISVQYLKKF